MANQKKWDEKMVIDRLEEAAEVMERLPNERMQGYPSSWPETLPGWEDYGWDKTRIRLGPPSPDAIDRMDSTLGWLRWLEPNAAKLVWSRAKQIPWKLIMRRFGLARSTVSAKWKTAISQIVAILNLSKNVSGHLTAGHIGQDLL